MNIEQFFEKNWPVILTAILVYLLKEWIRKILHWIGESFLWLLGFLGVHVLLLRRYKKSLREEYHKTRIGYGRYRIDLSRNFISLNVSTQDFIPIKDRDISYHADDRRVDAVKFIMKSKDKHTVILGHPGSGKTTLLHYLLLRYAMNFKDAKQIPIYIELRKLEDRDFLDYMKHYLKIHQFTRFGYIKRKLKSGKCLVMFDGLDEIIDIDKRRAIMQKINEFATEYNKDIFIVTSRIEGFFHGILLPSFRERSIMDLNEDDRRDFIMSILPDEEKPQKLIDEIENNRGLQRLAVRPLTLALLTFIYQETHSLPKSRIKIYDKCVDLLFEDRDRSKGLEYRNKYDSELKIQILRKIAFEFTREGIQNFHFKDLKIKIENVITDSGLPRIDYDDLIMELTEANGILRRKSRNEYDFTHLTFQEYFTALEIQYLNDHQLSELIAEKLTLPAWREVFLFYVQLCESPGTLVTNALQKDELILAAQLALHGMARLPVQIRHQIYSELLKDIHKNDFRFIEQIDLDMLCDLSKDGYEIFLYEKMNDSIGFPNKTKLESLLSQINDNLNIIRTENYDKKHPGMVYVPAGIFTFQQDENIFLDGFWIGLYPITNADFKQFIEETSINKMNDEFQRNWEKVKLDEHSFHPVIYITWHEAAMYCNWRSQHEGLDPAYDESKNVFRPDSNGYRLPTEQEWEKAAAWDDFEKKARQFPWGNTFDPDRCNNSVKRRSRKTSDVRHYENGRSFYGCYDMAGNVWEWTSSLYKQDSASRVVRGGSWFVVNEGDFRCSVRFIDHPVNRGYYIGFRVVRSPQFYKGNPVI
ncbi:SUMF1/EgtB/PvdO family nonheme iron enzyme [candidate division KSB1 bacterium]|nr:SUMF1/EgtB/PvdO family nonheme iron enzyme [candidate division KSB1 bacterium]